MKLISRLRRIKWLGEHYTTYGAAPTLTSAPPLAKPNQAAQVGGAPGIPNVGGQGFNPAAGGTAGANFMPEATREHQSGKDKQGGEVG